MRVCQNIANYDVCKKAFATVETGPVYKNMKPIWHLNNIKFCSIFAATLNLHGDQTVASIL